MRPALFGLMLCACFLCACAPGGGSSGTGGGSGINVSQPTVPGANVLTLTVNAGLAQNSVDSAFTTVTICAPGTSSCQSISGIVVDTGSYGLRLFASQVSVNLPAETSGGSTVVECAYFGSFTTWGPMKTAALTLGSEPAINVPVQIMNDPKFPAPSSAQCSGSSPPAACQCLNSAPNPTIVTTAQQIGSNGILGVGVFTSDCGAACSTGSGRGTPGYYLCPASDVSGCSVAPVPDSEQAQNPVWLLPTDNNGVVIDLPAIPAIGAETATGSLILGINTQSNNALGNATIFPLDASGEMTTTYNGTNYISFIDSGSNGLFFPDSSIPSCSSDPGFYCPPSTLALSAVNTATNGTTGTVMFDIANANALFDSTNTAFNDLGGSLAGFFDWGLPFFFGRPVFFGIAGQNPSLSGSAGFDAY